jgi:phosphoenolpyruvate synthase/pyruvate phosphate dikinase
MKEISSIVTAQLAVLRPDITGDCLSAARFIRPFRTIRAGDVALVGGKNASLGEMYSELSGAGVRVPNGFAVTADAYRAVLDAAGAWTELHEILDGLVPSDVADVAARARRAHQLVAGLAIPPALRWEILGAYHELQRQYGEDASVAVRSSATAEDLPGASFAGQHETFLNVRGDEMLLEAYSRCLASLFLERAIYYRIDAGFDHFKVALSVGIMKMVRSDLGTSGVAFTLDTESGFRDVVFISGAYGLGEAGDVLVAPSTTPDWEPVMKIASAIVTERGGRTCHAAIVARELGIPAVVGADGATALLADGADVTVSCAEGDVGRVYAGRVAYERTEVDPGELPRAPVKVMLILADPDSAFGHSALPNDGVGLVRLEFIVSDMIGVHPMAIAQSERVDDAVRAAIAQRAAAFATPADFFVRTLAEGVGQIAAAFYPKPVIVRMSDFKTNEYAHLAGGSVFEPSEENPMLGFRGAARYAHPAYADGFALECAAMKRVRESTGLQNVILMIPFCRRVEEGERVVARMAELGLRRGENGLQIFVMCEIPNNVVQIDAFSRVFDGFSIGSNDLAQLVLGVDRDSALVAFDFDERDPGVLEMLRLAIEGAKRNGRYVGICGQAPSDYPEVADFLAAHGIDSIGLNPDSVVPYLQRRKGTPLA